MSDATADGVSKTGRWLALIAAFLGWYFAGMLLQVTSLTMRPAAIDLLSRNGAFERRAFDELSKRVVAKDSTLTEAEKKQDEKWQGHVQQWFAYFTCAFLFGGAAGGLGFGRLGDRYGRAKALAGAVLCYATFSGVAYFVRTPEELLVIWFLACLGVGGSWPNGVALVAEIWANLSRPLVSGIIGMAANIGIFVMATIALKVKITPDDWRWTMLIGASTLVLGILILLLVPESPKWLAARDAGASSGKKSVPLTQLFGRQYLGITLLGVLLATVPIIGGWGSANWMIPWADQVAGAADPFLKAKVGQYRSFTGIIGSCLGGWIAARVGRRRTYFVASLAALGSAQYAFWFTTPTDPSFLFWVGTLGLFSGLYFGWLPLCLPELFPTTIRSTGAGVCFNFGRIGTAVTVFLTGTLKTLFNGDYARIGQITSLIYAIGVIAILFAPDTSKQGLEAQE